MKILITGASGFVGAHLINYLRSVLKSRDQIFGTCLFQENTDFLRKSYPKVAWIDLDLETPNSVDYVIQSTQPDLIFHLAAMSFVPDCEREPERAYRINVQAFEDLMRYSARLNKKPRVVTISTSYVYDVTTVEEHGPLTESSAIKTSNVYAYTKHEMEKKALMLSKDLDIDVIIMRPFNHIGPMQLDSFVVSSFAKQVAEIELGLREMQMQVGDLTPRRDFTDVRDIVRAYYMAAMLGAKGEIYNVCSGASFAIQEILDRFCVLAKKEIEIVVDEKRLRKNDLPNLVGNCQKFHKQTSWKPLISIDQTLKDTLNDWIKRLS